MHKKFLKCEKPKAIVPNMGDNMRWVPENERNAKQINDPTFEKENNEESCDLINELTEEQIANSAFKMLEDQNFINLINEYSGKYENLIRNSTKAAIILAKEKNDSDIVANYLQYGKLNVTVNEWAVPRFVIENSSEKTGKDLNVFSSVINPGFMICNSSYLSNNNLLAKVDLNIGFLQRILNTLPTKFILAVKDITIEIDGSPDTQRQIKGFVNTLKEFTNLLKDIKLSKGNVSIVFLNVSSRKSNEHLEKIIEKAIAEGDLSNEQKLIIHELKNSIYSLPKAGGDWTKKYPLLRVMTEDIKNYTTPNLSNKIAITSENVEYIKNSIEVVKNEIQTTTFEHGKLVEQWWEKQKSSIFKTKEGLPQNLELFPNPNQLIEVINVIKDYKNTKIKTLETLIDYVKKLQVVFNSSKLENFLNYLKYSSEIKIDGGNGLKSTDISSWSDNLFSNFTKKDLKAELLKAFEGVLSEDEFSFLNILKESIQVFYKKILHNKTLNEEEVVNIDTLKNFFRYIKDVTIKVRNFDDIKEFLTSTFENLPVHLLLPKTLDDSISNLIKLTDIGSRAKAESLWKYITRSLPNIDIDELIYDKLLCNKILPNQNLDVYDKLEKLLIESSEYIKLTNCTNITKLSEQDSLHKTQYEIQLAKIYCYKAQINMLRGEKKLAQEQYEKAAKLGSAEANLTLGKIELDKGNYSKALNYFENTDDIKLIKETFDKLTHLKEEEIKDKANQGDIADMVKLTLELGKLYSNQAAIYKKHTLELPEKYTLDLAKTIYINTIAKLKEIGNVEDFKNLASIYKELAKIIDFPAKQKFIEQESKYEKLAAIFNNTQNIPNLDPKKPESDEDVRSEEENDLGVDEDIGSDGENDLEFDEKNNPDEVHFKPYEEYFAANDRIPLGDLNFDEE